ncbi:hypothetical protein Nepgr_025822 [Nepenthes gracilis]|uniref:Uncharacterized protein n=1 Tax=Nepenthes gracilis TaxID=150966 RepID=A0AAD3T785_NEPGR|nr:hypothetical protein Nepgr_025822 [Nepenthes gracilis]
MSSCKRLLTLLLRLLVLFTFFERSHGIRSNDFFRLIPSRTRYSDRFSGFSAKSVPVPASGPSRKHNDIGLQSSRSP